MGWVIKEIGPAFNVKNQIEDPPKVIIEAPSGKTYVTEAKYCGINGEYKYISVEESYSCDEEDISGIYAYLDIYPNNPENNYCSVSIYTCY